MKSTLTISAIGTGITRKLMRFHVILFTLIVVGGLAAVVYLLYGIVISAIDVSGETTPTSTRFDQQTIDRLEEIDEASRSGSKLQIPQNQRINPFIE